MVQYNSDSERISASSWHLGYQRCSGRSSKPCAEWKSKTSGPHFGCNYWSVHTSRHNKTIGVQLKQEKSALPVLSSDKRNTRSLTDLGVEGLWSVHVKALVACFHYCRELWVSLHHKAIAWPTEARKRFGLFVGVPLPPMLLLLLLLLLLLRFPLPQPSFHFEARPPMFTYSLGAFTFVSMFVSKASTLASWLLFELLGHILYLSM